MHQKSARANLAFAIAPLAALILVAFSPVFFAGFTDWDDIGDIARDPGLRPPTLHTVAVVWTQPVRDLYIPITRTFWAALAVFAQPPDSQPDLRPTIFHMGNLAIHFCTVLVVLAILRLLIDNLFAAAIGAALFAIHPLQTESVAWLSGTKDLLAGFFGLLAVWKFLLYCISPRARLFILSTLYYIVALLCKPSAVAVPLIAGGLAVFALRIPPRKVFGLLLVWLIPTTLAILAGFHFQPARITSLRIPLVERPLIAADALAFYLFKLIMPIRLCIDYGRSPHYVLRQIPFFAWWTWAFPLPIAGVLWLNRHRCPTLTAAGWVFLAGALPVLGLVPFDFQRASTVTDHYLYVSMLGPALAAALLVRRFARHRLTATLSAVFLIALAARTFFQSQTWIDGPRLYANAIAINDRSWLSHVNLAVLELGQHDLEDAVSHAQRAYDIAPDDPLVYTTLGAVQEALDQPAAAEATYRLAIARFPDNPIAYANLGSLKGNLGQPAEAIIWYKKALSLDPNNSDALTGLQKAGEDLKRRSATSRSFGPAPLGVLQKAARSRWAFFLGRST